MNTVLLIACISMMTGFFIIFDISLTELVDNLFKKLLKSKKGIKADINKITGKKKSNFLKEEMMSVKKILEMTGRENRFSFICMLCIGMSAVGISVAIIMDNMFLIPVLGIGCLQLPLWYVKLNLNNYKKEVASQLETTLSVVTTAYLRTEDMITAISENIEYLNEPIRSVFNNFLLQVKMINPNMDKAIKDMKTKIDNPVYKEWCDAVLACQYNRKLKTTLIPIVNKLSDMRIVNGELDNLIAEPRKEFITMALFVIGNIPLMYFLNKDWYNVLMHSIIGQIILAICITAIFISSAWVIKLTQPIEYRR